MGTRDRARGAPGEVEDRGWGDAWSYQAPPRTVDSEHPPAYDVVGERSVVAEPGLDMADTVSPSRGAPPPVSRQD